MKRLQGSNKVIPIVLGVGLAVVYGVLVRVIWGDRALLGWAIALLLVGPTFLGVLPFIFASDRMIQSVWVTLLTPVVTIVVTLKTYFSLGEYSAVGVYLISYLLIWVIPCILVSTIAAFLYGNYRIRSMKKRDAALFIGASAISNMGSEGD